MSYRLKSPLLQALSYQDLVINPQLSTESAGTDRILARIKDLVLSIGKTIITNTRYFKDDFKRSEFQSYMDHHKSQIDLFIRSPVYQLPNITVPVPEGMLKPYPEITTMIAKQLASYNLSEIYQDLNTATSIVQQYTQGHEDATNEKLKAVEDSLSKYDIQIVQTEQELKSMFSKEPIVLMTAIDAFGNKEGVASSCNQVLSFNNVFRQLNTLKENVETINRRIDQYITHIESSQNEHPLPKDLLRTYGQIVSTAGQAVDHFGLVLHEAQRVEHMFTAAISVLITHMHT